MDVASAGKAALGLGVIALLLGGFAFVRASAPEVQQIVVNSINGLSGVLTPTFSACTFNVKVNSTNTYAYDGNTAIIAYSGTSASVLQSVINAGGTGCLSKGVYSIGTTTLNEVAGSYLIGAGNNNTVIKYTGTGSAISCAADPPIGNSGLQEGISYITLKGKSSVTTADGIHLNGCYGLTVENVVISTFDRHIQFDTTNTRYNERDYFTHVQINHDVKTNNNDEGLVLWCTGSPCGGNNYLSFSDTNIIGAGNLGTGIKLWECIGCVFDQVEIGSTATAVDVNPGGISLGANFVSGVFITSLECDTISNACLQLRTAGPGMVVTMSYNSGDTATPYTSLANMKNVRLTAMDQGTNPPTVYNVYPYPPATSTVTAGASVWTYTNLDAYNEVMQLSAANGIIAESCNGVAGWSIVVGTSSCVIPPGGTMSVTWAVTAPTYTKVPLA